MTWVLLLAAAVLGTEPRILEVTGDSAFVLAPGTPVVVADETPEREREAFRALLAPYGEAVRIVHVSEYGGEDPAVFAGVVEDDTVLGIGRLRRWVRDLVAPRSPEGCRIIVRKRFAIVAGQSPRGLRYGLHGLAQLADASGVLPEAQLRDQPWLPVRAVALAAPPTWEQAVQLARLRCNTLILSEGMDDPCLAALGLSVLPRKTDAGVVLEPIDLAKEEVSTARPAPKAVGRTPLEVYAGLKRLEAEEGAAGVQIAEGADPEAVRIGLLKAWAPEAYVRPWPEGLNALFGASLFEPSFDEAAAAIVAFVNRSAVNGRDPEAILEAVEGTSFEELRGRIEDPALDQAEALFGNVAAWLNLERTYADSGAVSLNAQRSLVESQAQLDPAFGEDRREAILAALGARGGLVPSSVLFRRPVLPLRPLPKHAAEGLLEVPVDPELDEQAGRTRVELDLLSPPAPIVRLDFETAGTTAALLEGGSDGEVFSALQNWPEVREPGGPLLIEKPPMARFLRLTVEGPGTHIPVRHVRVFGRAPGAQTIRAPLMPAAPTLNGAFKEQGWPIEPQIRGFVNHDGTAFAAASTAAWAVHHDGVLYLGAYLREPRMATRVRDAVAGEADALVAVLSSDEADVRAVLRADGALLAGPAGVEAACADYPTGWGAEMALPLPKGAERGCRLELLRQRRNVRDEDSRWQGTIEVIP